MWFTETVETAKPSLTRLPSCPTSRGLRRPEKSQNSEVGYFNMDVSPLILWWAGGVCLLDSRQRPASCFYEWLGFTAGSTTPGKMKSGGLEGGRKLSFYDLGQRSMPWTTMTLYRLKPDVLYDTLCPGLNTDSQWADSYTCIFFMMYFSTHEWYVVSVFAEHKVIIVGLDNAGKTTILYQL